MTLTRVFLFWGRSITEKNEEALTLWIVRPREQHLFTTLNLRHEYYLIKTIKKTRGNP